MFPAYSDSGRRSTCRTCGVEGDSVYVVQDSGRGTTGRWDQGARGTQEGRFRSKPGRHTLLQRSVVLQGLLAINPVIASYADRRIAEGIAHSGLLFRRIASIGANIESPFPSSRSLHIETRQGSPCSFGTAAGRRYWNAHPACRAASHPCNERARR